MACSEKLRLANVEDRRLERVPLLERRGRAEERTAVELDDPLEVRGRGERVSADSVTNSSSLPTVSIGLNRRSKPIVVEAFELIDAPQSEPAT